MSKSVKWIAANMRDDLHHIGNLLEAISMAAEHLEERPCRAISEVVAVAQSSLDVVQSRIEELERAPA